MSTSSLGISGGGTWGSITGTLANQADLQAALNARLSSSSLSAIIALSNLAAVGTISSGLWQGTTIGISYGGTNATSYTPGQLLSYNGTSFVSTSTIGTNYLTGTLGTVTGGTGISSSPNYGQLLMGNGSGSYTLTATSSLGIVSSQWATNGPAISYGSGYVGIGTTTPGSLFSIGAIANLSTATSSFYASGGINLANGCFAIGGNCLSFNNISGTVSVNQGGTGGTTFGQGWLYSSGGTTAFQASTSPLVNYITATSTTATSTFAGPLSAQSLSGELSNNFSVGPGLQLAQFTPTNASTSAPFSIFAGGGVFSGIIDPVLYYGYNVTQNDQPVVLTDPVFSYNIEGNYWDGTYNLIEAYSEYYAPNRAVMFRPDYFQINRGTSVPDAALLSSVHLGNPYQIGLPDGTIMADFAPQTVTSNKGTQGTTLYNSQLHVENVGGSNYKATVDLYDVANSSHGYFRLAGGPANLIQIGGSSSSTISDVQLGSDIAGGAASPYLDITGTTAKFVNTTLGVATLAAGTSNSLCYNTSVSPGESTLSTCSSDQRLKQNISSLDGSTTLTEVMELNPVSFTWNPQFASSSPLQFGLIAQAVQKIWPNLVSTTSPTALTPDGTLSINFNGLWGPVFAAIQELDLQLTSLNATVAGFAQSITTQALKAATGNFHQITADELCAGTVCVDQAQLAALLASASQSTGPAISLSAPSSNATDTSPVIQISGTNPATIQVGTTYSDLGATITGPAPDLNLGIQTYLNGSLMSPLQIDTSKAATDTISYVVTDQNGLTSTSTRTVIIQVPQAQDASSTAQ